MTPFVTLPHGFAMTRRLAASSPIGTISMSSVDFFLRVATPFQLPLFNFYERVSSIAEAEADAVSAMMFAQLLRVSTSHQHLRC
jgi:hypothetical protein